MAIALKVLEVNEKTQLYKIMNNEQMGWILTSYVEITVISGLFFKASLIFL